LLDQACELCLAGDPVATTQKQSAVGVKNIKSQRHANLQFADLDAAFHATYPVVADDHAKQLLLDLRQDLTGCVERHGDTAVDRASNQVKVAAHHGRGIFDTWAGYPEIAIR
jgi:hypothetical protein